MVITSVSFNFVFITYPVLSFLTPPGNFSLWFSRCLIHFLTANMPGAERPLVHRFTHDPLSPDMCAQGVQSLAPVQSPASVGLFLLDGHPPALACVSFYRELKCGASPWAAPGGAGSWPRELGAVCPGREGRVGEPWPGDEVAPMTRALRVPGPDRCSHRDCQQLTAQAPASLMRAALLVINFIYNVLRGIPWHFT